MRIPCDAISARLFAGSLLLLLITGCASTPQSRLLLDSPPDKIRQQVNLDDVPFFPQRDYQCGPAALATVMNHSGVAITPEMIAERVYVPARKGSLQLEMIAATRSEGLVSYRLEPTMQALLKEINGGNPVLVFQNLSFQFIPQWHYAVVIGYDFNQQELILRSGDYRQYRMGFETFERTWQRAEHWAYVMLPAAKLPVTAEPVAYAAQVNVLNKAGKNEEALVAIKTAIERWPNNSLLYLTAANIYYELARYDEAEDMLTMFILEQQASKDAMAMLWNNLAYIYAAKDCKVQALEAIACARSKKPLDKNITHSEQELSRMIINDSAVCKKTVDCGR